LTDPSTNKQQNNTLEKPTPPNSAKALSKYTDMVDAAVREALDKLAGATDAARVALRQVRACAAETGFG
jgi:programmed cell death 6-interacting protein